MTYTLSDALQDLYGELGQSNYHYVTTGGVTSTVTDANFTDDGDKTGYVFITRDVGGNNSAPEGMFRRVSAFTKNTGAFTIDALSAAVAVGDEFMYVNSQFPVRTMIRVAINAALRDLGTIWLVDSSITTAAQQTEYTLPTALKGSKPFRAEIQTYTGDANDNRYVKFDNWRVETASPGSTGLFITNEQFASGYTIKLHYFGEHPQLNAYGDVISETIPQSLLIAEAKIKALRWYVSRNPNTPEAEMYNDAKQELINLKSRGIRVYKPSGAQIFEMPRSNDIPARGEPDKVSL